MQKSLDTAKDLLKDLGNLQTTLDKTADDTTRLLEKSGTMLTSLSETLATASQALQSLNDTLRSLRATSDTSLQNTLTGMMDVLDEIIANSSAATTMQQASSSIHNLIKDELDQMETDSNLLNMDNSLPLQSFTSSQNPAPVSLQFLLRTEEINPEEAAEAEYTAPTEEETGVFDRIANVFKQLFAAVKEIFSQDN